MNASRRVRSFWLRLLGRGRTSLSHDVVRGFASRALGIIEPEERKTFMEGEIRRLFGFQRVEIMVRPEGAERWTSESTRVRGILGRVTGILEGSQTAFLNDVVADRIGATALLAAVSATYVFPIRQRQTTLGLLLIDSTPRRNLAADAEHALVTLCDQLALVLENSSLLKSKLELQHTIATQAQMVQIGEMTSRIAHEIKNPLSAIKTIVQVMQEDPALHATYAQDLELIRNEIDRLTATVGRLLNFAAPAREPRESVQLRELAASVIAFLQRDMQAVRIQGENEIPAYLPLVSGTGAAFREVLLNLLVNSIQAADDRTTFVRLTAWEGVLEDGSERFVMLVVEDDGPGIPAEFRDRVFQPFFTTRQRGTGLGLAIVKREIEHIGGRISLESPTRDERGTRFLIHLPVAADTRPGG